MAEQQAPKKAPAKKAPAKKAAPKQEPKKPETMDVLVTVEATDLRHKILQALLNAAKQAVGEEVKLDQLEGDVELYPFPSVRGGEPRVNATAQFWVPVEKP